MCYMIFIRGGLYTDTLPNLVLRRYRSTLYRKILARMNRVRRKKHHHVSQSKPQLDQVLFFLMVSIRKPPLHAFLQLIM
jgi:hypothetical protein